MLFSNRRWAKPKAKLGSARGTLGWGTLMWSTDCSKTTSCQCDCNGSVCRNRGAMARWFTVRRSLSSLRQCSGGGSECNNLQRKTKEKKTQRKMVYKWEKFNMLHSASFCTGGNILIRNHNRSIRQAAWIMVQHFRRPINYDYRCKVSPGQRQTYLEANPIIRSIGKWSQGKFKHLQSLSHCLMETYSLKRKKRYRPEPVLQPGLP